MKKTIFIFLLCIVAVFAVFAIDMSPHPGDTLETVLTVQDDVIIMSQAAPVPAADNTLHLEQFNNNNEICMATTDEWLEYIRKSGTNVDITVAYIGFEMETDFKLTDGPGEIYHTEYG